MRGLLATATLLTALLGCDRELGPPPILDDVYCTDACQRDPALFGFADANTCADWCEQEESVTQELLNCLAPEGLNDAMLASRWRGCQLVLGAVDVPTLDTDS